MNRRTWMLSKDEKIGRSLSPGRTGGSLAAARRRSVKRASMLLTCVAVAVAVMGAILASSGRDAAEPKLLGSSYDSIGLPPDPYLIIGVTYDSEAAVLPFCTVTVTDVDIGASETVLSDADGKYLYNLASLYAQGEEYRYADGDLIHVDAVKGELSGHGEGYVDTSQVYDVTVIDVTLEGTVIPEFTTMIVPIVGMMALFAVAGFRRKKKEA